MSFHYMLTFSLCFGIFLHIDELLMDGYRPYSGEMIDFNSRHTRTLFNAAAVKKRVLQVHSVVSC